MATPTVDQIAEVLGRYSPQTTDGRQYYVRNHHSETNGELRYKDVGFARKAAFQITARDILDLFTKAAE